MLDTGSNGPQEIESRDQCKCLHTHRLQGTCCYLLVFSCSPVFSLPVCNFLAWLLSFCFSFLFSSLRLFNEEALKDYERFRRQEVRDLKEVLAAHIKTQIVLCKLVCLAAWLFSYHCISVKITHLLLACVESVPIQRDFPHAYIGTRTKVDEKTCIENAKKLFVQESLLHRLISY